MSPGVQAEYTGSAGRIGTCRHDGLIISSCWPAPKMHRDLQYEHMASKDTQTEPAAFETLSDSCFATSALSKPEMSPQPAVTLCSNPFGGTFSEPRMHTPGDGAATTIKLDSNCGR